ncbi:acetylxylan esterase [bacterium]|nr:acetylxylan esterase [bacterium]
MAHRNISTRQFFLDLIKDYQPELTFRGRTPADFRKWQRAFRAKFRACLGPLPRRVPLAPEILWEVEEDGLIKRKVYLDTAPWTTVPAILLVPKHASRTKLPAVVAVHGHGDWGKDPVAGSRMPEHQTDIKYYQYDYGYQMAKRGYVAICPDLRPFGERSDHFPGEKPLPNRDPCNVHALKGWLLGFNLLTYNLWDLVRCIDYLETLSFVDRRRIGALGLAGGGAHVMHLAALDRRIKATDIICALNSFRGWGIEIDNFCGSQFLPGMFRYGDHAEICGLIAPRPLLVENGGFDYGFPPQHTAAAVKQVKRIYAAAGVPERFDQDLGYVGHQFMANKCFGFFDRWLKG